jgi:hypothetical protein
MTRSNRPARGAHYRRRTLVKCDLCGTIAHIDNAWERWSLSERDYCPACTGH